MDLELKMPLSTYFEAQNAHDVDAMLACFTEAAMVRDEGQDMLGRAAIRPWMEETTRKYSPSVRPTSVAADGERTIVTAQVSGAFPGSPIELRYRFTISGKKVARLAVG